jgi:N-acetyltransferase
MPFELQPNLRGELLRIRALRADDFDELFKVASDPLIWQQHPDNRHELDVFRKFFDDALESGGALAVIDLKDERIIGSSRYHRYDLERSEIEIGWTFLARSHWGGLYNGELKRLMLDHAFKFVENVIFRVNSNNLRSQRALEKIGALRVGTQTDPNGRENFIYRIRPGALS